MLSSQIEGTQATLEDVLDPLFEKNANQNVVDVINYIRAAEYALNRLDTLPLCNRLLKETHAILMEGVRGQEKKSRRIPDISELDWRCGKHAENGKIYSAMSGGHDSGNIRS